MNTLIALCLGLLLDALIDHHTPMPAYGATRHWRAFPWIGRYLEFVGKSLNASSIIRRSLGLVVVLLPIPCMAALIYFLLSITVNWLGIIFEAIILMFCLLPLEHSLAPPSNVVEVDEQAGEAVYETFNGRFAIFFWFALLGAFGALLYRILNFLVQSLNAEENNFSHTGIQLHHALGWIPARITAFLFALVGAYTAAYQQWHKHLFDFDLPNRSLLKICALAALSKDTCESNSIEDFLMRTSWAWLVLLAVVLLY